MESRVKAALFSYSEERRDDPDGSQMVCEKVLSGKLDVCEDGRSGGEGDKGSKKKKKESGTGKAGG